MRSTAFVAIYCLLASCAQPTPDEGLVSADPGEKQPADSPPVAALQAPVIAPVGQAVLFSAQGSYDPDGGSLQFEFDFGDQHGIIETADETVKHIFSGAGVYRVRLRVLDTDGNAATAAHPVTLIENSRLPLCIDRNDCTWGDVCLDGLCYFEGGEIIEE